MSRRSKAATSIFLAIGGILVIFGIGDMQGGPLADPAITIAIAGISPAEVEAAEPIGYRLYDFATRMAGLNLVFMGLLLLSVAAVPYRMGERWAWATMWLVPAWSIAIPVFYVAYGPAPGTPVPPPAISGPIVAVISSAALIVERGRFVRRRVPEATLGMEPA